MNPELTSDSLDFAQDQSHEPRSLVSIELQVDDDAPYVLVRERFAFHGVLLGDEHGAEIVERKLLGPERRMVVERMRLDFEPGGLEQVEKTLRIADAGD